MSDEDDEDELAVIRANLREWQTARYWRDKPVGECGSVRDVLIEAGRDVRNLRPRPEIDQPPDCEGTVDGHWCGIERTELVHEATLKRSSKAQRERRAGKDPKKPEAYFVWHKESLLDALKTIIDKKDRQAARMQGGPYDRYMLVMETDETELYRDNVKAFLVGASFRATHITDAFLGLGYHGDANGRGCCPVFTLQLVKP